jgi:acyl-CoA synthetase (NDP forming)
MVIEQLELAFHPGSVAVVGASSNPLSPGYRFVLHLVNYGYRGKIYPVTLNCSEVLGLKAYPSLRDIPGSVDYVICCLPAAKVLDLLAESSEKAVKFIHLFTGRFGETGQEDAARLEMEVLRRARALGIRLIGPNCMGIYYPKEGMAFAYDLPTEPGKVGMISQSGGAVTEFVRYASLRGIRFSKVISYGNALDLNEADFLEYLCHDPETEIIAGYVEGVRDGSRFLKVLRQTALVKPVIILKAGRGNAGARAAASHTAALAGSFEVWETAMRQVGAVQARTLEDMMDLVVSFCFLPPILGTGVGIVGGGGGKSVLSADAWEKAGFTVCSLPPEIKELLQNALHEMWWRWIGNPVDVSIFPEEAIITNLGGNILRMMAQNPHFDLLIGNISVGGPVSETELAAGVRRQVEDIIEIHSKEAKPLAVVLNTGALGLEESDKLRWKCLAEEKAKLLAAGIAVYSTADQAADAIIRLVSYHRRREAISRSLSVPEPYSSSRS